MMDSKVIVVLGATGVLGGAVARHFHHELGYRIRAVSRTPDSAAASLLREEISGVEIVRGDLDDEESLFYAFQGAQSVFVRTHYWQVVRSATTRAKAKEQCVNVNQVAMLHESQQWLNVFNALSRVAEEQLACNDLVLEKVVLSTLSNSTTISRGKYTRAFHFESKATGVAQLSKGAALAKRGYQHVLERSCYLHVGAYLESFFSKSYLSVKGGKHLLGPQKQEDGTFVFQHVAYPPYHRIPLVLPRTDLGPLVEALVIRAQPGTHLLGGQPLTLEEFSHCWGRALGLSVKWEPVGVEDLVSQMPADYHDFARTALQAAAFVTEFGFDGSIGAKWPTDLGVPKEDLVDIEQWVQLNDWSSWL